MPCSACRGARIRPDAAATRFNGLSLGELTAKPLGETLALFQNLKLSKAVQQVAGEVIREITSRLKFLVDVGLDYLSLSRPGPTLSGGEAQRIRLASQIGSGLTGVLYVLDEPLLVSIRATTNAFCTLARLRDLGNTLVLVEHDREVIAAADYLLDFGPALAIAVAKYCPAPEAGSQESRTHSRDSISGSSPFRFRRIAEPLNRLLATRQRTLPWLALHTKCLRSSAHASTT